MVEKYEYEKGIYHVINDDLTAAVFVKVTNEGIELVPAKNFDLAVIHNGKVEQLFKGQV